MAYDVIQDNSGKYLVVLNDSIFADGRIAEFVSEMDADEYVLLKTGLRRVNPSIIAAVGAAAGVLVGVLGTYFTT